MADQFNRLCRPEELTDGGVPLSPTLARVDVLAGQHEIRSWEYTQAQRALEAYIADACFDPASGPEPVDLSRSVALIADIGGANSNFWKALTTYTTRPIYRLDPDNTEYGDGVTSLVWRQTLQDYLQVVPDPEGPAAPLQFDAVFAISVLEHVPQDYVFLRNLASIVAPGGLLVLTCDAAPSNIDSYHFAWMRCRIYSPQQLRAVARHLEDQGLRVLGDPADWTWHGPTVYDYTVASLAFVKEH